MELGVYYTVYKNKQLDPIPKPLKSSPYLDTPVI
jgi:hypothetical protein